MGKTYKEKLIEEIAMKHYYDGWTVKGMEKELKKIEELEKKCTLEEFHQHQATWLKEWNNKYRLLDVDFETYMIMNTSLNREDFKKMIKRIGKNQTFPKTAYIYKRIEITHK